MMSKGGKVKGKGRRELIEFIDHHKRSERIRGKGKRRYIYTLRGDRREGKFL